MCRHLELRRPAEAAALKHLGLILVNDTLCAASTGQHKPGYATAASGLGWPKKGEQDATINFGRGGAERICGVGR
jgi:hypothetical protein